MTGHNHLYKEANFVYRRRIGRHRDATRRRRRINEDFLRENYLLRSTTTYGYWEKYIRREERLDISYF
jgi:hypothetical protein